MGYFTDILLRVVSRSGFTTKGSNLTSTEVDDNFLAIADELNSRDILGNYQTWSAGTVAAGVVRIYDSKLWLSLTSNSVAPSEGSDWTRINFAKLGHNQNTDTALDENGTNEVTAAQLRALYDRVKPLNNGIVIKAPGNTSNVYQDGDYMIIKEGDTWGFIS